MAIRMSCQKVLLSVTLLALCSVLLPGDVESAGGIISIKHTGEEKLLEALPAAEETRDDPDSDPTLLLEPESQRWTSRIRRDAQEASVSGRVRRAPEKEEGKGKKKKDKTNKKNKEPKDPSATKKPKADKKGRKKDKGLTTTPAPTTTEPVPTSEPYSDYTDNDDYWNPKGEETADPEADPIDDYWKPEGEPDTPTTDLPYDDYWKPEEGEGEGKPASPVTDAYDDYWKPDEGEREGEPASPVTDAYDDYWKAERTTPPNPEVDGKADTGDEYWDATFEVPDNLPFPDGKEVTGATTETPSVQPPYEDPWYGEYDYGQTRKQDEEKERVRLEKQRQERENELKRRKEEEDRARARQRPRVFKEPKKCPPLGMESHRVEPDQLVASSMTQYRFGPHRARLNMQGSDDEDSARGGAWCAMSEDRIHWLEFDARKETEFTGIITQGRDSRNESDFVTSFYLAFSNDSREWTTIHDGYSDWLFFGNSDADTPVMNQLAEPVLARYMRIIPQSWNGSLCMRLEVLGCPLPAQTHGHHRQNEVTPVDYLKFKHHSYSDMITLMKSVSEECPNITSVYSLGQSSKGLDITAMIISGNPTEHEIGEPEFRFTAGLHGNEATGREIVLLLMQYLCKEYNDGNPRVRRLVEGMRIHLVPSLNPDGHEKAFAVGSELSGWTTGHFTEDGHDIFQNFPDLTSVLWNAEDNGMVPKLMPNHHIPVPTDMQGNTSMSVETRAIMSWMESIPFVLGANFQGGERIVAYPYDNYRLNKAADSQNHKAHSRQKRQYEEEGFDVTEWGQGYHEEPEEDGRNRGYQEPEEDWRDRGYQEPEEEWRNRGYQEPETDWRNRGYQEPETDWRNRGYQEPETDWRNRGYQEPEEEWRGHGHEGHGRREEEEDDRGRGGYQYAEPEDEPRATADESLFRWLAISYASTHLTMTHSYHGSCHGNEVSGGHGIVNRGRWKPVTGSMNDFSYLHTNCFELSVFLGCDKFPHESDLAYEWEKNREAMLTFMEQVHRGIRGVVKDQEGNPIANATVSVEGVNHDVTTAKTGDFWRLLNPGEYQVTVRAEGYTALTRLCVVGYEAGATACSFNLAKSNWDRIKQIMALHGNKPIRLLSNGKRHNNAVVNRRVAAGGNAMDPETRRMRLRKIKIARLRRLRQERLKSMTTLPPTTTTIPTTTESTTSWYDSWMVEGQTSAPEGFKESILDYNYEYKIDDY